MKAFLTYSGKGGVGKTTVTYCLYKSFKELGLKTLVIDMDLNTPSMHQLITDCDDLITAEGKYAIFLNKVYVNEFVQEAIRKVNKVSPDILLIDTPPSITDVHQAILKKLKVSTVILVSQPSELSRADVEKTVPFFIEAGINISGIIENMVEGNPLEYKYPKLMEVNKVKGKLDSISVYGENKVKFLNLANVLLNQNAEEVTQHIVEREGFNEEISWEIIARRYQIYYDEESDTYSQYGDRLSKRKSVHHSDFNFVNLSTWKRLQRAYSDIVSYGHSLFPTSNTFGVELKDPVIEATYERVERLVNAFKESPTALFMIIKNPCTVVPTIAGEIGECTLAFAKQNNLPCVEYRTEQGLVKLYPHEVIPVGNVEIKDTLAYGGRYFENGNRLIPGISTIVEICYAYGRDVGMPDTKKGAYELYQKVTGIELECGEDDEDA